MIADGEESCAVGLADGDSVDGGGEAGEIGEAASERIGPEFLAVEGGGAVDRFVDGFTWERPDSDDEEIAAATDAVFEEVGDAGGESLAEGKWEQGIDGGFWVGADERGEGVVAFGGEALAFGDEGETRFRGGAEVAFCP